MGRRFLCAAEMVGLTVSIGSGSRGRGGEGADGSRVGVDDMHVYSIRICVHASSSFLNTGAVFWRGWRIARMAEMVLGSTGSADYRRRVRKMVALCGPTGGLMGASELASVVVKLNTSCGCAAPTLLRHHGSHPPICHAQTEHLLWLRHGDVSPATS